LLNEEGVIGGKPYTDDCLQPSPLFFKL